MSIEAAMERDKTNWQTPNFPASNPVLALIVGFAIRVVRTGYRLSFSVQTLFENVVWSRSGWVRTEYLY